MKAFESHRLRTFYRDEYKRVTLSPASNFNSLEGRYENNNMLLFTGEALLLMKKQGVLIESDFEDTVDAFKSCEIMSGLFQRHPEPYGFGDMILARIGQEPYKRDIISHDEYNGIMYACAVFPELRDTLAVDVVNYGEENDYEYFDVYPDTSYAKEFIKKPVKVFQDTIKMYRLMNNKEEYRGLVGIAESLTQKRQKRDICFYKIMSSKHSPNLFETLYLAASTIMSTRKPVDYKSNSGRVMALYRMWAIEEVGHKSFILKMAHKYFRRKCRKQFGEDYVEVLHRRYFKRDAAHPFLELSKGLK